MHRWNKIFSRLFGQIDRPASLPESLLTQVSEQHSNQDPQSSSPEAVDASWFLPAISAARMEP